MAIYRGNGGSGDARDTITINEVIGYKNSAEQSATNAANSATAASTSEGNAATSASAASTSAANAVTSETNAASSASAAATSASNAGTSATNAATSETNAATSASNAASSATAASTSESNAAASETAAALSATNASTSETNAAASETAAASSASAASTSATNAATSASSASTSASNAATSETNAATSETNAAASATAAAASAASAASSDYAVSSWYTTTNNSSNWDTAYGWGDHASAGYVVADGAVVINESGADVDFRIESDTNANALFLEGSSGNLGIGTGSPSSILHTRATAPVLTADSSAYASSGNGTGFGIYRSAAARTAGYTWTIENAISSGGSSASHYQTDNLLFKSRENITDTTLTEQMRITASGYLLVGTTTYRGAGGISINGEELNSNTTITTLKKRLRFATNGTDVGYISTTGTTTTYSTSSDYRLKENNVNITDGITRVKQLNPYRFNFIAEPDNTVDGFYAHEVQSVVPEAVTGTKDAMRTEEYEVTPAVLDDDGNVVEEAVMGEREVPDYQGIDQSKLVPLLTSALKEAIGRIETLEARITALES